MSEREHFVSRWGWLKREPELRRKCKTELREDDAPSSAVVTSAANETETRGTPTSDLTSLPSIDSITADTDIRMFLKSGVPAKLTAAALRRAWVSDPGIRDFIGIAENQWDFTNPTMIPGFGPVQDTGDELSLILQTAGTPDKPIDGFFTTLQHTYACVEKTRRATGDLRLSESEDPAHETQAASEPAVDSGMSNAASEDGRVEGAAQNTLSPGSTSPQRCRHPHGGALPRWDLWSKCTISHYR
jgi:hypothetical protein